MPLIFFNSIHNLQCYFDGNFLVRSVSTMMRSRGMFDYHSSPVVEKVCIEAKGSKWPSMMVEISN